MIQFGKSVCEKIHAKNTRAFIGTSYPWLGAEICQATLGRIMSGYIPFVVGIIVVASSVAIALFMPQNKNRAVDEVLRVSAVLSLICMYLLYVL